MDTIQLKTLIQDTLSSIPWQTAIQPTLPDKDVSVVLHEPAIKGSYRVPYKHWRYYFFSLFQLHNETVNVWSHLIGILFILNRFYSYFHEFDVGTDSILSVLIPFGVSCVFCLFISASVHLLHARSPFDHFVGFMIDYIGAAINTYGYGVAFFYGLSHYNTYHTYKHTFLPLVATVSFTNFMIMCLAKIWYGHDPHNLKRKYMMLSGLLVQSIINFFPAWSRYPACYHDDDCLMTSLNHISIMPIVFILQAISFAAHQPERTWPGKFDIVGHGHQIFHVFIVVNMFFQMDAIYKDNRLGVTSHCEPNMALLLGVMLILITAMALVLIYLTRYVPDALRRVEAESANNNELKVD